MSYLFAIAMACATPLSLSAQGLNTVEGSLELCEKALVQETPQDIVDALEVGNCIGVVRGVNGVLDYNCASRADGYEARYSARVVSLRASLQAFVNWARANPAYWDFPLDIGVMTAVAAEFPCDVNLG